MERSAVAWEEYLDADEPQARQRPAGSRRWLVRGVLALLVLTALVVSAAQLLAPATPQPAPAAPTAAPSPAAAAPTTPNVTAWPWPRTGMVLPVSPTDGPQRLSDVAAGFARTELGAALAAAHLSVRVDPAAGAEVFRPTIEQQMTGDTARVLAAVEAAAATPATSTPATSTPASITGYRVDAFTPDAATVHLRVVSPGGAATDFAVPVVWDAEAADWLLVAPAPQADALFATSAASGNYVPFITEEPR